MNSILLSFLCGSAFIGGAASVLVVLSLYVSRKSSAEARVREAFEADLMEYWRIQTEIARASLTTKEEIRDAIRRLDGIDAK